MDFEEMNRFMGSYRADEQDVRLRIKRRTFESRERRWLGVATAAYGFDLFIMLWGAAGALISDASPVAVRMGMAAMGLVLAGVLSFVLIRMRRRRPPSPGLLTIPGWIMLVLGIPSISLLLIIPNVIAVVAIHTLGRVWTQLSKLESDANASAGHSTPPDLPVAAPGAGIAHSAAASD
jgi:hypothetical protein